MNFGLCIIGCGSFSRTFAAAIQGELGDIDLYFASRDHERAARFASEFGGSGSFGSYESAVADSRIGGVYICTPTTCTLSMPACLPAPGKHILLEKPLARTGDEARAIVQTADQAGVTLMVAENYRFMPPVLAVREMVERGDLGSLSADTAAGRLSIPAFGMAKQRRPERRWGAHRRRHTQGQPAGLPGRQPH